MDQLRIIGGVPLKGRIRISGAKNATLPLMAASLLTAEPLTLTNFPQLADVLSMQKLLQELGVEVVYNQSNRIQLQACDLHSTTAPYDLVRKMRASILVLGPLVARKQHARISLPGGCAIGTRPVDLHLKGLEAMGAQITLDEGYVVAEAPRGLRGAEFCFPLVSVTGTENLLMAATLAKGTTCLRNAAREPEVTDLANCLVAMGAQIEGIGTDTLIIHGVDALQGTEHFILPDRIETGTYAIAAGITGGELELMDTSLFFMPTVVELLQRVGLIFEPLANGFRVKAPTSGRLEPQDVTTAPYPLFATDLQAQFMALMTIAAGSSIITETIFENRFMHVAELNRMGADITVKGNQALVRGVPSLKGAPVMATDLRASVSLVLAGLAAEGETIIHRVYHLDRGYEKIEDKLIPCGAIIERVQEASHHDDNILSHQQAAG
jgi:UDP-N-acetylglucosamine 1-carboxyvinyltransferase